VPLHSLVRDKIAQCRLQVVASAIFAFFFSCLVLPFPLKASQASTAKRPRPPIAANLPSANRHGELGRTLLKQEKYEEATAELGIAANEMPESRAYNMALVEALLGWEHWGVAADFLNAIRERFSQYPEFHYYLGLANFKLNKTKAALPEFEEALRMNPRLDLAKYGLAACRAATGDLAGAAALSRALVKERPRNARYWLALAQVLDSMGETERREALRASRRALALRPGDPVIELKTAVILTRLGQYAAARPLLAHVVKLQPGNSQAHVTLASTYAHLGERALAQKETEIVVQLEKSKAEPPKGPALTPDPQ
jgi:predicted Zn-dependent protease